MEHAWLGAALVPFEGKNVVLGKKEVGAVAACISEGLKVGSFVAHYRGVDGQVG